MSSVALVPPKIEGRICPRTRLEEGGRYLLLPQTELFSIRECPGNRVRYSEPQRTADVDGRETNARAPSKARGQLGHRLRPPPGRRPVPGVARIPRLPSDRERFHCSRAVLARGESIVEIGMVENFPVRRGDNW